MSVIKIAGRKVGDGQPCFIIAEAGSNHDGNLEQAYRLIDVAAEAGADAVKFQNFHARTLYPVSNVRPKMLKALGVTKTLYQTIEDMEMPQDWIPRLAEHCHKRKILFMSTPFDEESVEALNPFVPAFKIASYEMTHIPLIEACLKKKKPLIVSTGAASMSEIDGVVKVLRKGVFGLMQCTAKYPAPPEALNLNVIRTLKERFKVPVGLSDHSLHPTLAAVAAVGFGSSMLEKHYTLSRRLSGPDHSYAIEPHELKELVRSVRQAEQMGGSGKKIPHPVELDLREYRRGVYTLSGVKKGEVFTAVNTAVLRRTGIPATDLGPDRYPSILGRKAARTLPGRHLLARRDVGR